MPWSTRQLAELADTTVNAVRHYHKVGLLDVPERGPNGYKRYEVPHLIRLLQITRLTDLGIPLARIAGMGPGGEGVDDEIRSLDAELESTITRLTRVRSELAAIMRHRARADTPAGFAPVAQDLTDAQRSMLTVYSTVFGEGSLEEFRQALAAPHAMEGEFENLPEDADEATIDLLVERMAPAIREDREKYPQLVDPAAHSPHGARSAGLTMAEAVMELYNPAQLQVLLRLAVLLERTGEAAGDGTA